MEAITLQWPGGEHDFRLSLGQLSALQDATDCGPEFLLNKISLGQWKWEELSEVLRLGLSGADMAAAEAKRLVHGAFERHPHILFKAPAQAVLGALLFGPPDDVVGEPLPVNPTPADTEQTENGS